MIGHVVTVWCCQYTDTFEMVISNAQLVANNSKLIASYQIEIVCSDHICAIIIAWYRLGKH